MKTYYFKVNTINLLIKYYNTDKAVIRHVESDFSLALLNAICSVFNEMSLQLYIQMCYEAMTADCKFKKLKLINLIRTTLLNMRLCCFLKIALLWKCCKRQPDVWYIFVVTTTCTLSKGNAPNYLFIVNHNALKINNQVFWWTWNSRWTKKSLYVCC